MSGVRLATRWGLLLVFLTVFGVFSAWVPRFSTTGNLQDILTSQPPGIFIAYAAMLVLVVGEFDLSIGATLGISQYVVLKLVTHYGLSWGAALFVTLVIGAAIGLANAIAVVGLGINSFIATIGVATILEGLLQWISDGNSPIFGGAPHGFTTLAQTKTGGIVLPVYYALAASVLLWVLLEYTVAGRRMRATGANRVAATLSGIPTGRARVTAFVLAGLLSAIAGILVTARIGAADATSGPGFLLPAYAAAFLGATAIRPGFFNVWGTLIAIFLVAVGITGLQLKGAEAWVTPVFNGSVLLAAVALFNVERTQRILTRVRTPLGRMRRRPRRLS
jgi:ribose transport system permease protein